MHSKIDGPAAYDVLDNFEDRWKMGHKLLHFIHKTDDDLLLDVDNFSDVHAYLSDSHPEAWNVQVFRSIDSNSVKSFPNDPREACRKNLTCGKNIVIDSSIQKAYIHAIRAAQHFIYIENQYFIGSSFNWDSHQDRGANNLIPIEIALKIANKIKANERFAVYVVIPMWPEGNPTESLPYPSVQRILYWQIYGYRMSLWAEHIGFTEDIFDRPESVECVRSVRAVGEANWRQFAADETTEMRGHLLKYPLIVSPKGKVGPIPNQETFPDVGGDICGSFMPIQEMFKMQENLTI
ncbi:hypothetical protein LUZ60_011144 [Juncus effusus]|nr:hypothetical protein LUZ60_011144 [Juncus effusus]